jgi:hypothetical protein
LPSPKYQVYGLDETYPEFGSFSFKIVLNPRFYKTGEDFDVILVDSDRRPLVYTLKKWGRKLNVDFHILQGTSDGVAIATILRNSQEVGRLNFWVIKP